MRYSDSYLRFVWSAAAATTLMSYSLWAFEQSGPESWHAISIVPFVLGLMRYAVDIDAGKAAEPEDIVFAATRCCRASACLAHPAPHRCDPWLTPTS